MATLQNQTTIKPLPEVTSPVTGPGTFATTQNDFSLRSLADNDATTAQTTTQQNQIQPIQTMQATQTGVSQLPVDSVQKYTSGDPAKTASTVDFMSKLNSGEIDYAGLPGAQQQLILQGLDQAFASDPLLWNTIKNETMRNAYISKFGNPQEGVSGTAQNTINADGRVQSQYRAPTGGAYQGQASDVASMDPRDVATAAQNNRTVGDNEASSNQLNDILSQDSPLMALARQDGVRMANANGLRNSSLAAGAQMAEMARQATPLALQQAEAYRQAASQNQALESDRLATNAAAQNQASAQEFDTEASIRGQNAAQRTQISSANAGMANDLQNADRQREMSQNLQQLAGDQDYAKQQTANQTAVDLANIEGQYKAFISENDTAARMFDSTYNVISSVMSNPEIEGPEATEKINYAINYMEKQMDLVLGFSQLDGGPDSGAPDEFNWQDYVDFGGTGGGGVSGGGRYSQQ